MPFCRPTFFPDQQTANSSLRAFGSNRILLAGTIIRGSRTQQQRIQDKGWKTLGRALMKLCWAPIISASYKVRFIALNLPLVLAIVFATSPASADYKDDIGYTKLQLELGGAMPTGSGVGVTQNEAPTNSIPPDTTYNYLPDTTLAEFSGKSFTTMSASGGVSSHATTVAQYYYGNATSIAPGITGIHNFEANDWIGTGFLNYGTLIAPKIETQKIENNSWIGSIDNGGTGDVKTVRRFDYAIQRDNFLAVSGLNNGSGTAIPVLMANSYNGLVVGLTSGSHSTGQTTADGTGRIKPDIVSQTSENLTSFATPVVGAAGALLYQKATSVTSLNSAANSVVLKSLLMAGATKSQIPSWNRPANSTQPMDLHYGAGQVNVFNSYHILVAGNQAASNSVSVRSRGWDYTNTSSSSRVYFFDIATSDTVSNFSAVLTWNRVVAPPWITPTSTLPNLFLKLYNASGFTLGSQVDSSVSTIDNVQLLYQPNLAPGRYALEVSSATTGVNYGLAWYSLPTVTIAATTPNAAEQGPVSGAFTVTRAGDTTDPLTVNYTISGTAGNGADYTAITGSVTIPAAFNSATITIAPISDSLAEGDETVLLTLSSDLAYSVGTQNSATVTIHDKPFDAWRFNHFTQAQLSDPSPSNITTATANPASDGIVNLTKYALNLNPLTSQTTSLPVCTISGGTQLQFTFQRNLQATDITLNIEACNDLTKPSSDSNGWKTIASLPAGAATWAAYSGTTVSDNSGAVVVTDGVLVSTHTTRFLRLRVTIP
jgi:hypothetical protein